MNKTRRQKKIITFSEYLKEQLKDPEIKRYYDDFGKQLEIAYEIIKLRKEKGISQRQLADKIGTSQGNIARIESGRENFTTETLQRIASAFGRDLQVQFVKNARL